VARYRTHAHYDGHVDGEVLAAEQTRIQSERAIAQKWTAAAAQDGDEIVEALDEALQLLEGATGLYGRATPHVRRLVNQALFVALYVVDDEVGYADPAPWIAAFQTLGRSARLDPCRGPSGLRPAAAIRLLRARV
jgi:hypothetical protein